MTGAVFVIVTEDAPEDEEAEAAPARRASGDSESVGLSVSAALSTGGVSVCAAGAVGLHPARTQTNACRYMSLS
jgi:hypothetical protein